MGTRIREERSSMKKTDTVDKANDPARPIQGITLLGEKENKPPDESLNLSPQRIMEGASSKTVLLNQILAQRGELHQVRFWGINE